MPNDIPPEVTPTPEGTEEDQDSLQLSWGQLRPRFKNRIFAGLLFLVPLTVTFMVGWWIYTKCIAFSTPWIIQILAQKRGVAPSTLRESAAALKPLDAFEYGIYFSVFIVTIFAIVLILWLIGTLSSSFLMRRFLSLVERFVLGVPVARSIYTFTKQIVSVVAENRDKNNQRVVIIEYPKKDCHVLAFATGETKFSDGDERHITVFVPTTPNPTSGFMLVLPESEVREANLSVEEAARIIISGGIIVPEEIEVAPYGELPEQPPKPAETPESHA